MSRNTSIEYGAEPVAMIFSSPGSGNLSRVFDDLQKRGGEVRLFFPNLPVFEEEPQRDWIRNLILRPSTEPDRPEPLGSNEVQAYRNSLDEEIRRWSKRGKWKVAIETI